MKCAETKRAIEKLLDGELSQAEVQRLREHLERCRTCAGELREAEATREAVGAALRWAVEACDRAALLRDVERAIAAHEMSKSRERRWVGKFLAQLPLFRPASTSTGRLAVAFTAGALLLAAGTWWFVHRTGPVRNPKARSQPHASVPIAEVVPDSGTTVLYLKTEDPHLHIVWFFQTGGTF